MDIHPGNLLATGEGLRLIDWEYAADGDVALDIAALFRGNGWSAGQQQHFCSTTRARAITTSPGCRRRRRWLPWVDYLMLLWFEVRWQQSGDAEFCAGARRCAGDFVYHHPNSERTIMK